LLKHTKNHSEWKVIVCTKPVPKSIFQMNSSYGNKISFPDEWLLHLTLTTRQRHFCLVFFPWNKTSLHFFL